jgi:TRAP-type C4-dicarboxylate transport system substrate-binding protein
MKIRSIGGICSEYLEALGAVPVMMQSAESYTGLQSGVVDAVLYPDGSAVAYKLYEVAKYSTAMHIMHMGIPYAMNKKFFNSLDDEQKDFIYCKMRQASQMASHAYDIDDKEALKIMLENGVERIKLSDAEMARVHKAVEPVIEEFIAKNEAKGLPVKELLADIKKLRKKYDNMSYEETFKLVTEQPIRGIINY